MNIPDGATVAFVALVLVLHTLVTWQRLAKLGQLGITALEQAVDTLLFPRRDDERENQG
jgi:hypothetical protein